MDDQEKDFKLSKKVKTVLQDKQRLKETLGEGKTAQELMGFSNELMGTFYAKSYHLFEKGKNHEAADAFLFLASLNPKNHDYWLGLGMATQRLRNYESAIDAYEMAAICDLESPVSYFYLAKCLFAIHDKSSSLEALNLAIEYAGDQEIYRELKTEALHARDLLLKDSSDV